MKALLSLLLLPALLTCVCATLSVSAQDTAVTKSEDLAKKWRRTKSLAEPKEEIRRTKGVALEIIEVKVDADTEVKFNNILFALDSERLAGGATLAQIREIAAAMQKAGAEKFLIEGHTCDLGTEWHNKALAQRRAETVVAALVQLGVPAARLQPLGFGSEQPVVANTSEAQRSQNRRVQIYRKL